MLRPSSQNEGSGVAIISISHAKAWFFRMKRQTLGNKGVFWIRLWAVRHGCTSEVVTLLRKKVTEKISEDEYLPMAA
jgi:hypothetical protein